MKKRISSLPSLIPASVAFLGFLALGGFVLSVVSCRWDAAATLLAGLVGGGVVWWQGRLIKDQIQFQSFIEFDKEWNSPEVLKLRETAFDRKAKRYDLSKLEGILEFFEKLAAFRKAGVLDMQLLFASTLGWYAVRYYRFSREEIEELRTKWKERVYGDLEDFYEEYVRRDVRSSNQKRVDLERDLDSTKASFIEGESG